MHIHPAQAALLDLLQQLKTAGIYTRGHQDGRMAGAETLDFARAEAAACSVMSLEDEFQQRRITFADCGEVFGSRGGDEAAIDAARTKYEHGADGDVEIDEAPVVSRGENGAHVMAWLFVRDPGQDALD